MRNLLHNTLVHCEIKRSQGRGDVASEEFPEQIQSTLSRVSICQSSNPRRPAEIGTRSQEAVIPCHCVNMSAEDSDSDCSVVEVSDFDEEEDGDGVSVICVASATNDSSSEDSCGFFSDDDDDLLDENWNKNNPTIGIGSTPERRSKRRVPPSGNGTETAEVILPGKCTLCENLESVDEDDLDERCQVPSAEPWCKCGKCRVVSYHMKKYDRICCHELSGVVDFIHSQVDPHPHPEQVCITLHPKFKSDVLEYGALYRASDQGCVDKDKLKRNRDERDRAHSSNCSFVRWIWDRMGYGHRIMPPACVVAKIREFHMKNAPFWYYHNFIPGKFRCETGRHCVAAANDTCNIK